VKIKKTRGMTVTGHIRNMTVTEEKLRKRTINLTTKAVTQCVT